MWRRLYFTLVLLRLYFALSPSYLHPDEHFQGPEIVAGYIYGYETHKTWEFDSSAPIRSVFPLFPVYGLPMVLLRWLWEGSGNGMVPPSAVFWVLRVLMFALSFVSEDWAIHELIEDPRHRRIAMVLVASSYVTSTWQAHTFSNALETILVLWTLVLINRIISQKSVFGTPLSLGFLLVLGVFNRVTFPAFVFASCLQSIPAFWKQKLSLVLFLTAATLTLLVAITVDTAYYTPGRLTFPDLIRNPIITPLNNLRYNTNPTNLHQHGQHPFYQHFIVNLPQLLGPAFLLLHTGKQYAQPLIAGCLGIGVLSIFPHQEARFLTPVVPLFLSAIRFPLHRKRIWLASWLLFNAVMVALMGVYHQGGVVPAQIWLEQQDNVEEVFWWKTYSPPTWLLGARAANMTTIDLMGKKSELLPEALCPAHKAPKLPSDAISVLVAPKSAVFLDQFAANASHIDNTVQLKELWHYDNHLNLDDLDFGDDGLWPTLQRVVGRRGLVAWEVECRPLKWNVAQVVGGDW